MCGRDWWNGGSLIKEGFAALLCAFHEMRG